MNDFRLPSQATRILAQVLVAGATVVFRAATQAWGQALANAQKTGVAQEAVKTATGKIGQMSAQEAQMILGVDKGLPWGEVVKRYKHLFEINEKHGSFYLQSKVFRAKEALEDEYKAEGKWVPEEGETQQGGNSGSGGAQGEVGTGSREQSPPPPKQ